MAGDLAGPVAAPCFAASSPPTAGEAAPPLVERLRLVSFERSLWRVGIEDLERSVAELTPERVREWFDADLSVRETVVLRTCQRVLVLAVLGEAEGIARLSERLEGSGPWTERTDGETVRHLYRVTAGLESRAPGEAEIRAQVRATVGGVLTRNSRPVLRRLLGGAVDAAEHLPRTGGGSVADLAVDWLLPRLPRSNANVLVIGNGTAGRRAAERLSSRACVTVAYRHRPPDRDWLERSNVRACPSDVIRAALRSADAVIAAAKSTGRVLGTGDLPTTSGPRWFVDLGLPRNIDPEVARRPDVVLVDLDTLPRGRLSDSRLLEMSQAVETAAQRGIEELTVVTVEPWVSELRRWAEAIRREEWERALKFAGPVPDATRIAFDRATQRLVRRLLSEPSRALRSLAPGPELDLERRRLLELFGLPDLGT